jgi:hypothetical protein
LIVSPKKSLLLVKRESLGIPSLYLPVMEGVSAELSQATSKALTGKETALERRPDGRSVVVLVKDGLCRRRGRGAGEKGREGESAFYSVAGCRSGSIGTHLELDLEVVTVESRVVGLLSARSDQAEAVGNAGSLLNLSRSPLGGSCSASTVSSRIMTALERALLTPVEGFSSLDEVVEASDDLLHWCSRIVTVSKDDIDIVHLQASEGLVQALDQVLAREPTLVGVLAAGTEEDLGKQSGAGELEERR